MIDIKKISICYFGTPEISAFVLEKLINDGFNICCVVTQPDKLQGRKNILTPSEVKIVAQKHNIPIFQPIKLRLDYEFLKQFNIDLILTLSYGQIVPHEVLEMPKYGSLNLHGSLLPKYRGAAPIQYALLNGDKETGITLMEMIDKMDAGKVYYKKVVEINDDDNYTSLVDKLKVAAYDCFIEGASDVINGLNKGIDQDEKEVTFTHKILKDDELISFEDDANTISNKIRSLAYNPGAYFVFNNEKIKIFRIEVVNETGVPGKILKYDKNGFVIACKNNSLKINELQKPGKKIMNFKDFYNGNQNYFKVGDFINNA